MYIRIFSSNLGVLVSRPSATTLSGKIPAHEPSLSASHAKALCALWGLQGHTALWGPQGHTATYCWEPTN